MPRCEPWEWGVDHCLCRLKSCQLDATEVATDAAHEIATALNNRVIDLPTALQQLSIVMEVRDLMYELCVQEDDVCKGRPPRPLSVPPVFAPPEKPDADDYDKRLNVAIAAAAFGATVSMGSPAAFGLGGFARPAMFSLGAGFAAAGVGWWMLKVRLNDLITGEPPAPDWETVVQPSPPLPPDIPPSDDLSPDLAAAFNAVLQNQALSIGMASALTTSLDRASAADTAGSASARDRQIAAARDFAGQWAELLGLAGGLRSAAAARFVYPGVHGASIVDILSVRDEIWGNGWPQAIVDIADSYSEQPAQRDLILDQMSRGLSHFASLKKSPIEILESRELIPHEERTAETLSRFANG